MGFARQPESDQTEWHELAAFWQALTGATGRARLSRAREGRALTMKETCQWPRNPQNSPRWRMGQTFF
jgi:hypothetical protein